MICVIIFLLITYKGCSLQDYYFKKKKRKSWPLKQPDEPWGHYGSEISQSQKANTVWFHLLEISKVVKLG